MSTVDHDIAAARDISVGYHVAGNRSHAVAGGVLVVDLDRPQVSDANVLLHPVARTASTAVDVVSAVIRELAHADAPVIQLGATRVAPLEARLAVDGWSVESIVDMLLDGPPTGTPRPVDIRPVVSDADWSSLRQLWRIDDLEEAEHGRWHAPLRTYTDAVVSAKRAKQPSLRLWLAAVDSQDAASSRPGRRRRLVDTSRTCSPPRRIEAVAWRVRCSTTRSPTSVREPTALS